MFGNLDTREPFAVADREIAGLELFPYLVKTTKIQNNASRAVVTIVSRCCIGFLAINAGMLLLLPLLI
jgi:hypothetical protein